MEIELAQTPFRILLVEDDEDTRELTGDFLRDAGADTVTLAPTAESALDHLRAGTYGMLITDIGLPGLSGLEMLDEAAREGLLPDETSIIVYSAAHACTREGVLFMQKPVDVRALHRLVRAQMERCA